MDGLTENRQLSHERGFLPAQSFPRDPHTDRKTESSKDQPPGNPPRRFMTQLENLSEVRMQMHERE